MIVEFFWLFVSFYLFVVCKQNSSSCLLGEFGDGKGSVLLRSAGSKWGKSRHEEVQTWERNHVHGKFAQISVQLAGETKTRRHA